MNKLPGKLSDLITLAYDDAKKIVKTPGYILDMGKWHSSITGVCRVCLAGAVMSNTLGVNRDVTTTQNDMGDYALKLAALDKFRKLWLAHSISSFYGMKTYAYHLCNVSRLIDNHQDAHSLSSASTTEEGLDFFFSQPLIVEFRRYLKANNL